MRPLPTFPSLFPFRIACFIVLLYTILEAAIVEDLTITKLPCVTNQNETYDVSDSSNKLNKVTSVEIKEVLFWRA